MWKERYISAKNTHILLLISYSLQLNFPFLYIYFCFIEFPHALPMPRQTIRNWKWKSFLGLSIMDTTCIAANQSERLINIRRSSTCLLKAENYDKSSKLRWIIHQHQREVFLCNTISFCNCLMHLLLLRNWTCVIYLSIITFNKYQSVCPS